MAQTGTAQPFEDIRGLLRLMPDLDEDAAAGVRERDRQLTKPPGSLGRLEAIVEWLAAVQGKAKPTLDGRWSRSSPPITAWLPAGVSPYPPEVTRQMLDNFSAGGAAINQICATFNLGLKVFDLALDMPTQDITEGAAMDEAACAATMAFGMEALAGGVDLLVLGEMGIGNTTIAAAIYHALYGGEARHWVGRGTGVDNAGLHRKIAAVSTAVALHRPHIGDPLEVLRRLGGREVAAIAGAILAARTPARPGDPRRLCGLRGGGDPSRARPARRSTIAWPGHLSAEGAHRDVLARIGKEPLLDLGMRLGEGSGGALAFGVVKAALACHRDMATFAQAGVADKA